jgi:hypothetical protein
MRFAVALSMIAILVNKQCIPDLASLFRRQGSPATLKDNIVVDRVMAGSVRPRLRPRTILLARDYAKAIRYRRVSRRVMWEVKCGAARAGRATPKWSSARPTYERSCSLPKKENGEP